jgi:hypothetical protein
VDQVGICNLALGWLGEKRITSIDDESTAARLCKDMWTHALDNMIASREWTFARQRFGPIAASVDVPAFYYTKKFQIPSTVLRVLRVEDAYAQALEEWQREGDFIVCFDTTIYMVALVRVADVSSLPAPFAQALAARIAADLAIPVTQNSDLWAKRVQLAAAELQNAATLDGMQGRTVRITQTNLSRVR